MPLFSLGVVKNEDVVVMVEEEERDVQKNFL